MRIPRFHRFLIPVLIFFCFWALPSLASDYFTVRHVSDGDTIVLDNGKKVRLIGIDTPEMRDESRNQKNAARNHLSAEIVNDFAARAKFFVTDQIQGKKVRLEYDWQRTDKYGRTLAYVYREPDGYFLNAEIVRQGYGFGYFAFPFRYSHVFYDYMKEARTQKRGLWK